MTFFGQWLVTSVAVGVATWLLPGLVAVGDQVPAFLVFALGIAFVNTFIRPVMRFLSLPLTIITLGLFHFVVNAAAISLASWLSVHITGVGVQVTGFGSALLASIVISIVSNVTANLCGFDKD